MTGYWLAHKEALDRAKAYCLERDIEVTHSYLDELLKEVSDDGRGRKHFTSFKPSDNKKGMAIVDTGNFETELAEAIAEFPPTNRKQVDMTVIVPRQKDRR